jgi:hypothetical protein
VRRVLSIHFSFQRIPPSETPETTIIDHIVEATTLAEVTPPKHNPSLKR